jgi:catechol 2,3-dioxygenase-like lactoylglutathione lyase family enzyme
MKDAFVLGAVGHFGLAVKDPKSSAAWFERCLLLEPYMQVDDLYAVGNDAITIWFHRGKPHPETIEHISFALKSRAELERALAHLKHHKVEIEDPGHEIGPQAPDSQYIGIWFYDPDGYRWEFSVKS